MLILEVGVDFPVFYEKEKAYRFLIHWDWSGKSFAHQWGGSKCIAERLESNSSCVFREKKTSI